MTASPPASQAAAFAKGLAGVIAGQTAICSLDGTLRYRGYAIEPLAVAGDFEEVAWLLLHGDLPTPRAPRDEGRVDTEHVEHVHHGVRIDARLHVAARGIAAAEARAVDAERAPAVAEQPADMVEEPVVAEQRRPEHDRRPRTLVGDGDRADSRRDASLGG